jgi:hypothetical protein
MKIAHAANYIQHDQLPANEVPVDLYESFIDENLEYGGINDSVSVRDIYDKFVAWHQDNNMYKIPLRATVIYELMCRFHCEPQDGYWYGIKFAH